MPKGVEHVNGRPYYHLALDVPLPVMPKGVEHPWPASIRAAGRQVPLPVMPKGVEHLTNIALTLTGPIACPSQ